MNMVNGSLSRRSFLGRSTCLAGCSLLPRSLRAFAPNSKLRTAHVGVGGMGRNFQATLPRLDVAAGVDEVLVEDDEEGRGRKRTRLPACSHGRWSRARDAGVGRLRRGPAC